MSRNWDPEGGGCGDSVSLLVAGKYLIVWSYVTTTFFWDNGLYYRALGGGGVLKQLVLSQSIPHSQTPM